MIAMKEGEESQLEGPKNIYNEIVEENFSKLKEGDAYQGKRSI